MLVAISLIWLFGWLWQALTSVSDILLLFFLAWLLAFVLDPLAQRLQRLGLRAFWPGAPSTSAS